MDKKWNRNRSNTMQLNGSQIFVEVLRELFEKDCKIGRASCRERVYVLV